MTRTNEEVALGTECEWPEAARAVLPEAPPGRGGWPWVAEGTDREAKAEQSASWPRITIVTPSFNQAEFLEETIRSVLLQRYPNLEYFVVDGGSTDYSVSIIEKYSRWIDWWVSERDKGQADALNKGFAAATGRLWGYLNSDDVFMPGVLHAAAAEYKAAVNKRDFWVSFPIENFGECTPVVHLPQIEHDLRGWVQRTGNLLQPGSFWSADLGRRAGPFDNSYRCTFDRKLFMEFLRLGARPITRGGLVATRFRFHSRSKTVMEHADNEENRFVLECQLLSLEYSRFLRRAERVAAAREARQLLMDRTYRRISRAGPVASKLRELGELVRLCPACLATPFFWGMALQVLRGRSANGGAE